ncbi:Coenzyme F420:L-glutamate ligase [uncultured archaeon]|nr:Coenzyme F420:L-glutamate ligase [uncultured archaeon]
MDVLRAIRDRRSIRKFKSKRVPKNILKEIIEAGMLAPSAGNLQRRKFFVLTGEAKKRFGVSTAGRFQLGGEPTLIVVCADTTPIGKYGERGELYLKMECAASIMNMMLAAHAHGLGTCWVGSFDVEAAKRLLKLPGNLEPLAIIPVGFQDEKPAMPPRKGMGEACEFLE